MHPRLYGSLKILRGSLRTLAWNSLLLLLCSMAAAAAPRAAAQHQELARRVDAILARADVVRGFWGVDIEDLDTAEVLYSHEADRLFSPASNTKLFTTAAALALIGPNYRFRTTIESAAPPDASGRLLGDLVLVGRGDPNLSGRALPFELKTERPFPPARIIEELADQVVARGVRVIEGDVVADDSFYVDEPYGQGWSQEDLVWESGAPVSALAVNDNLVYFNIVPGARPGELALVTASPFAGNYEIENHILTTPAGSGPRKISVDRHMGSNRVQLWGTIPVDGPATSEALAIEDPAQWCARLLAELLARRGVVLHGRTRAHHLERNDLSTVSVKAPAANRAGLANGGASEGRATGGVAAASAPLSAALSDHGGALLRPQPVVLAAHDSPPLGVDIRVINKVSQNLHAEMLLRLLGREKGASGSVAGGLEVLRGFLTQAGLSQEEYLFYDGSGLSRLNLVSPQATVKLLRYAASQPWGPEFIDTLPLAGVDGTLAGRFKTLPAGTVLRAKTGTLDHVNVLSGYLTTATGRRLVFSILGNHHTLSGGQASEVIDQIVLEAARTQD
jgi:D-alanyl-D-alanine carboxypeptidase/D-alanyl-D-alanine-endopeptidase (penicillin-binding protein 4)